MTTFSTRHDTTRAPDPARWPGLGGSAHSPVRACAGRVLAGRRSHTWIRESAFPDVRRLGMTGTGTT